jgi:hypothetical protein
MVEKKTIVRDIEPIIIYFLLFLQINIIWQDGL